MTIVPALACTNDDIVAIEDAELVLVGLGGRNMGAGDTVGNTPDDGCRLSAAGGAVDAVGIACGVDCGDPVVLIDDGGGMRE